VKKYIKIAKKFIKENIWFIIVLVAINILFMIELPYLIYAPGSVENVSERVIYKNDENYKGSINMASVSGLKANIPFLLFGMINPNWDIVRTDEVTLENETIENVNLRDKLYMDEAIANAKLVSLDYAKIPYEVTDVINRVVYLSPGNKSNLQINDQILLVDGYTVTNIQSLIEYVKTLEPGYKVNILALRDNKKMNLEAEVFLVDEEKRIGLMLITTYNIKTDFEFGFKTEKRESGPSGGLMIALAMYDALTPGDLTNGRKIVGTGTIDTQGNVGEISGIKYKLLGAVKKKADLFIVPKNNYEEAMRLKKEKKYDIDIVGVEYFSQTVELLKKN